MDRPRTRTNWTRPTGSLATVHQDRVQTFTQPTLKDMAAAHLRTEILSGRLRPGEKIDQGHVAATLGISRLPVREALIELTQENLVDTIPRRGCFVGHISRDDIADIYTIQGYIAGLAARRAAAALTDEQLAELRSLHRQMVKAKGTDAQGDLSFAFYRVVLDAGSSNRLRTLLRSLYQSLPVDYFDSMPAVYDRTSKYHKQLLTALEHRDGDAAAEAMARFHDELGRVMLGSLTAAGMWDESTA